MGIWLIVTIWMLLAGVFLLAICSAAARPIPQPVCANVAKPNLPNGESEMKTARTTNLRYSVALAIALAIVTTSCGSTNVNRPVSSGSSEPVKGATLLMDHSR